MRNASKLVVAMAIGLCGCDLSGEKAAEHIQKELTDKGLELDKVVCPEGKKDKDGEAFECEGFTKDSQKFVVDVKAKGGGNITWELRGRIVDPKELEEKLGRTSGQTVDCGEGSRVAVEDSKVECKAGEQKLAIVFTDNEGAFKVEEL
jgi:hypothetical protein